MGPWPRNSRADRSMFISGAEPHSLEDVVQKVLLLVPPRAARARHVCRGRQVPRSGGQRRGACEQLEDGRELPGRA